MIAKMIVTTSSIEELNKLVEQYKEELNLYMEENPDTTIIIDVDEDNLTFEIKRLSLGVGIN